MSRTLSSVSALSSNEWYPRPSTNTVTALTTNGTKATATAPQNTRRCTPWVVSLRRGGNRRAEATRTDRTRVSLTRVPDFRRRHEVRVCTEIVGPGCPDVNRRLKAHSLRQARRVSGGFSRGFRWTICGRYWFRTSDLCRLKAIF